MVSPGLSKAPTSKRFVLAIDRQSSRSTACDTLSGFTGLSKTRVKQAMLKGAVWRKSPGKGAIRIRRATARLYPGDQIVFYYDPDILAQNPPQAHCMEDQSQYGIWFKPAGLLTQGTRFGDHCSMTRQIEQHDPSGRKVFPVHRLDRETAGLVIIAYSASAAALISKMFHDRRIEKWYMAWVQGVPLQHQSSGRIDMDLDGRTALTEFECLRHCPEMDQTLVNIWIHTGRFHQIRRHFDMIGHPVIGDPRYGQHNKNRQGLKLVAYRLRFQCPFGRGLIDSRIDPVGLGLL